MPAKASGEAKTRRINCTQKNGDIYVLQRRTLYDPVKKYNKNLSTKLLAKIPKGTEIPVPTRPKRTKKTDEQQSTADASPIKAVPPADQVIASRKRIGMMRIIDHIGKASGIDDELYANTDEGTPQKIISLAEIFPLQTNKAFPV